jgi:lactoylglutathione lyase
MEEGRNFINSSVTFVKNKQMITGLFETHVQVSQLEKAMVFYERLPGIMPAHVDKDRRIAFYWLGKPGEAMLGLWETVGRPIATRHFAFRCAAENFTEQASAFLQQNDLAGYNFLNDGTSRPMVFAWMPAIAIYFKDPDGNELELIAMLPQDPRPERGIVSWEEWSSLLPISNKNT